MHEKRNFVLVLLLAVTFMWTGWAWIYANSEDGIFMKIISGASFLGISGWLGYALMVEDKLPDVLIDLVGSHYFEQMASAFCLLYGHLNLDQNY